MNGKTLFVLSGGGLAGLDLHVGMLSALRYAGIEAHATAGTSAGAIVAAFDASGMPMAQIHEIVSRLCDDDVRRERLFWKARVMWLNSFLDPAPIRALLEQHLPARFEGLAKRCSVFATNESTCECREFSAGPLHSAVLASMAIAGVFPAVAHEDAMYSDGGTTAYLPLPQGWEDFERVFFLVARRPVRYQGRGIVGRLLWNVDLLMEDQLKDTVAQIFSKRPDAVVLRPPMAPSHGSMRFDHSLIQEAAAWVRHVLDGDPRLKHTTPEAP